MKYRVWEEEVGPRWAGELLDGRRGGRVEIAEYAESMLDPEWVSESPIELDADGGLVLTEDALAQLGAVLELEEMVPLMFRQPVVRRKRRPVNPPEPEFGGEPVGPVEVPPVVPSVPLPPVSQVRPVVLSMNGLLATYLQQADQLLANLPVEAEYRGIVQAAVDHVGSAYNAMVAASARLRA